MANPDYASLLLQIGAAYTAGNTELRESLEEQCYIFDEELTVAEQQLFEYVSSLDGVIGGNSDKYVAPNPGEVDDIYILDTDDPIQVQEYKAYVGIYVSANGTFSGEYPAESNTYPGPLGASEAYEGLPRDRAQGVPNIVLEPDLPSVEEDDVNCRVDC